MLDTPGIVPLLNGTGQDFALAAAGTQIGSEIDDLDGLVSASIQARFDYGSGSGTVAAYVQSSLDQGTTWFDVACITFADQSDVRVLNLSTMDALTAPTEITDGALTANTALSGPIGDRLRAKVISTGTYAGSTLLSLRVNAR